MKKTAAVGTRLGVLIRHNKLRPNFDPGAFLNLYKIAHSERMWNNTASGFAIYRGLTEAAGITVFMSAAGGALFTTALVSSPLVLLPMELLQAKIAPTTMKIATTAAMTPKSSCWICRVPHCNSGHSLPDLRGLKCRGLSRALPGGLD